MRWGGRTRISAAVLYARTTLEPLEALASIPRRIRTTVNSLASRCSSGWLTSTAANWQPTDRTHSGILVCPNGRRPGSRAMAPNFSDHVRLANTRQIHGHLLSSRVAPARF